jgi:hypothetical protein
MKNAVFWDVAPCRSCVNRRFGGTYHLHLQGRKIRDRGTNMSTWLQSELSLQPPAHAGFSLADFSTMKMEAIRSSETSARTRFTLHHILDTFLRNVGWNKIYTAPDPRRRHSSQSPPWRPQILLNILQSPLSKLERVKLLSFSYTFQNLHTWNTVNPWYIVHLSW